MSPISTFVLNILTLTLKYFFLAVPKFVNFMSASCFPECKDLQPETFCRHYKTYCKSMVNIRKACKKTCGLCKYSVVTLFITCTLALMKKRWWHAFLLLRITLLQIKAKDIVQAFQVSGFFSFTLVFVTLHFVAPNRHQELIRSKGEFPIRISRALFEKFRVNYLVIWRAQLNLKAVILDFISRSGDNRSIL